MAWNPNDGWPDNQGWDDAEPAWDEITPRTAPNPRPIGLLIAVLVVAMLLWESLSTPNDPEARFALTVEDTTAYAYGSTDVDSLSDVRRVLDANPQVDRIVLRYVPGTTHLGINTQIAELIRARGIDTALTRRSYIASGGVDLFLAGEDRTMECGARIGVHSWQDNRGESPRTLGYDPIEADMQAFHQRLGVDPDFYTFTRDSAPHSSLYMLRRDDVERFDLLDGANCTRSGLGGFLGGLLR